VGASTMSLGSGGSIVGMAISKNDNRVFTWYDRGTVSIGTSTDLILALNEGHEQT
jgi:hypothetical protein